MKAPINNTLDVGEGYEEITQRIWGPMTLALPLVNIEPTDEFYDAMYEVWRPFSTFTCHESWYPVIYMGLAIGGSKIRRKV